MNLLDENYVMELIGEIESSQNREFREEEIKACEIYSGMLKEHVEDRIKQLYPKTWSSFSIANVNLCKRIISKLSMSYKQNPIRELAGDAESEDYSQLMKDADASQAWQQFDIYYNLHRYAAMWFSFVEDENEEQRIVLRPLAPFQFSRVVNSVGDTKVFIVNFPSRELYLTHDTDGMRSNIQDSQQDTGCKRFALWSKDQHVVVKYFEANDKTKTCRIEYEEIEGNPDNTNPLGMIPAAFAQQGDNAALPIQNPLSDQVVEFNQQYSVMLTGVSLQTFGHLVLKHPEDQKMPDEIYNSLFTYSRLPQKEGEAPTELDYLNPSPNLSSGSEILKDYCNHIVAEHLGDGSQGIAGSESFKSGLDRMIAQADVSNIIESNQQVYAQAENTLYQIVKAFYEASNDMRFKSDSITVKYHKAKPIQSEKEILENIDTKIRLGLIERYEAIMALDPNMSEASAKEKIKAVNQGKQDNMDSFF